jgi:hypothetical protein
VRLAEALEQTATAILRRVASAHGLPHDDGTTRGELIARIAERFGARPWLDNQLHSLNADEREVLVSARASAGELRGLLVDSAHPGAAESLADRGWLYRVFAAAGPLRGEVFVVPDELLAVLPEDAEPQPLLADAPPPAEPRWTDPAFSLFALVSALTRQGGHLEQEVRPWSEEPGAWAWDARWTFLRHLATSAGLVVHRADGASTGSSALARLLDDPLTLADRLWRGYLNDRSWSELAHFGSTALTDSAEIADTLGLRRALVDVVQHLPEGGWLRVDAVSAWLQRTRPTVVREQLNPRGLVQLQAANWTELELPLLRYVLLGPLYWLGLLGAGRDGQVIARRARTVAPSPEACHWEGTADLVAPARARLGVLLRAERYLTLRERGRVSRYHLVQTNIAAALGGGGSIAECRQLLQHLTQAPLPSAVDERLAAWDQRFGALEIRPAVLLRGRTADELDRAIGDDRVRPFVRARLGPEVAEVAAADALELANALRSSGHLPQMDAALRLAAEPRRAYAGLVDEQVLEFLLVSLLAFRAAWPERLAELEGSLALLERLEHQFPPERLANLRRSAERLAGSLASTAVPPRAIRRKRTVRRGRR